MSLKAVLTFTSHKDKLENGIGKFIDIAVKKSVRVMERNIKIHTPVKEGHLRRSITSRDISFGTSEVFNKATEGGKDINYAVFMEYGTKYIAPRAMFRKGVADSENKIIEIFRDEARKVRNPGNDIK